MTDKREQSPGGSAILRYEEPKRDFEMAAGGGEFTEAVEKHFEQHVGKVDWVFHELISDLVHLDVHIVPPGNGRDHYVLFTTGMSDREMTLPEGAPFPKRAELMVSLPSHWKLDQESFKDEQWYWPVRALKFLARFPHEYKTWLGPNHTIPNGDPAAVFTDGVPFCCAMLLNTTLLPEEHGEVVMPSGERIALYALHFLHLPEMSLKLNKGSDALIDLMDAAELSEVVDMKRPPLVRKKLFGLF